ncbi:MAG: riboflavin synthase [Syntrophorhabdales bacterium]|jgi:riboflavin synthase
MFTGIIEDVGTIVGIAKPGGRWVFAIRTGIDPREIREGDSVAVDGVCLTVIGLAGGAFHVDASLETLGLTTLKDSSVNDRVNLERAMRVDSRLGGHIVMGHVDGIGRIVSIGREGDSLRLDIEAPAEISRYIVKKGSVAIDGMSLTVNEQRDNRFTLNIIPYSAANTTIGSKNLGDPVNVETDILGRYVERFVTGREKNGLDLDFLYTHGYIKGR